MRSFVVDLVTCLHLILYRCLHEDICPFEYLTTLIAQLAYLQVLFKVGQWSHRCYHRNTASSNLWTEIDACPDRDHMLTWYRGIWKTGRKYKCFCQSIPRFVPVLVFTRPGIMFLYLLRISVASGLKVYLIPSLFFLSFVFLSFFFYFLFLPPTGISGQVACSVRFPFKQESLSKNKDCVALSFVVLLSKMKSDTFFFLSCAFDLLSTMLNAVFQIAFHILNIKCRCSKVLVPTELAKWVQMNFFLIILYL